MATPLQGVKILELGQVITAPYASMMLADLGANILKIENPAGGDLFRAFRGGRYSPHFTAYNRNKRSMTLDIRTPEGLAIARRLVAQTDVLLDNFRPDVLPRLGLDPDALTAANPRLIHASITGFGADGPYAERPAYDTVGLALSGMGSLFFDPQEPQVCGPTITDNVTGLYTAQGILAALFERERTGRGARVEVNMVEAAIAFMPDPFATHWQLGMAQGPYTRTSASQSYAFRCSDHRLLVVHLSSPDKFWLGLLRAIDRPELAQDPRFNDRMKRMEHYHELRGELAARFEQQTRAHWLGRLEAEDVPFAPVNAVGEVESDPQVRHLGTIFEVTHPTEGTQKGIRSPIRLRGERAPVRAAAPTLGEHTLEVMGELGYSEADIARLKANAVI